MPSYVPNATQTTEPVESRAVESAALEFRALKAKVVDDDARITALEDLVPTVGNSALSNAVWVTRFSGDGATLAYTLAVTPVSVNSVDIYINGVYQQKDTFTLSGAVITFSEAPPVGTNNIEVKVLAVTSAVATYTVNVNAAGIINSTVGLAIPVTVTPSPDGRYVTVFGEFIDTPPTPTSYSAVIVDFPAGKSIISTQASIGTGTATLLDSSYNELFGTAVTVLDGNLTSGGDNAIRVQWRTKTSFDPSHLAVRVYFTATYRVV